MWVQSLMAWWKVATGPGVGGGSPGVRPVGDGSDLPLAQIR